MSIAQTATASAESKPADTSPVTLAACWLDPSLNTLSVASAGPKVDTLAESPVSV